MKMSTTAPLRNNCWPVCVAIVTALMCTMAPKMAEAKLVDLSHDHSVDTFMSTPLHPKYQADVLFEGNIQPTVYAKSQKYSIAEHGGTHIDSPKHFNRNGFTLDQIPLENTMADGVMIDCSKEVDENPDYALTLEKVKEWEKANGEIPPKSAVILNFNWSRISRVKEWEKANGKIPPKSAVVLNFNWSRFFHNISLYFNTEDIEDGKKYRFPVVGADAINFLVDERDINILAMDTMGPDLMTSDFPSHVKMLGHNKIIVENIKDPGRLPVNGFRFYATPVKFVGGTGVQVRAFAVVHENTGGGGARILFSRGSGFCVVMAAILVGIFYAF